MGRVQPQQDQTGPYGEQYACLAVCVSLSVFCMYVHGQVHRLSHGLRCYLVLVAWPLYGLRCYRVLYMAESRLRYRYGTESKVRYGFDTVRYAEGTVAMDAV